MKRNLLFTFAFALSVAALAPQLSAQATDWKKIPIPPLPAFHPRQPTRIELPNGMIVLLQEDHELPLIDGIARIRGGSIEEPAAKIGMLDMYGEVWRTGGTTSQTGDQLDDYLEARAAKVETGNTADSTTISWSCLKGDFDDVFKIFADVLQHPEFHADKLELAQKEMNDGISRRNDDASAIAQRESARLAYGVNNPYVREPEYATVAAVTRQDLLDWHHTHVYPNRIILGVTGDFDSSAMEAKLRAAFGDWSKGPDWQKPVVEFSPTQPGYYLIPKGDVNQSSIDMVELGIRRDNPDYYATQVFNDAFGGGFSSRLFKSIRSAQGLAYGVGGGIGSSFDHPGVIRFQMATKSATTVQSIQAIYKEIDDLPKNPITEEEIKHAKDSILNSFVFRFDSPEKVLGEQLTYAYYGYPADYLERYRIGIEKVTKEDVARVAAKYVHKDRLAILVVGNTAEFDKPISALGSVSNLDITIPPAPGSTQAAPAPTASNPEGKALAAKVAEAMGGLAKLKAIKGLHTTFDESESVGGPVTAIDATIVFPDRIHVGVQTPNGLLTIVVTPTIGFMAMGSQSPRDLPAQQKNETSEQIRRDLLFLAQHADDPAFIFAAAGSQKIAGTDADILDVSGAGIHMRWYVDPQSGRVLREDYTAMGQTGPFQGETDLSNWTTTDGVTLPSLHNNKQDGKDSSVVKTTSIQFNPPIDPKLFDKPQETGKNPEQ